MNSSYDRENFLKIRLNEFLTEHFDLPKNDYYSSLDIKGFIKLKSLLSDINNILTLKVTLSFVNWITDVFNLNDSVKKELERDVLLQKPNSNGFDLWLGVPVAFAAEVKCNIPINKGNIYGSAQRISIEKDINGLINGKLKSSINSKVIKKFMVFLDLPEIREANEHLIKTSDLCKKNLIFVNDDKKFQRIDIVYGIYVSI